MVLSVVCAVAGLVTLLVFSITMEIKPVDIAEITPDDLGETLKICGGITSKYVSKNNHIFMDVSDGSGSINVVVFNDTALKMKGLNIDPYSLKEQDTICITGKVDIYKNELEIIPRTDGIELKVE